MLTMRAAAALLSNARSIAALGDLLGACGLATARTPLDADVHDALGLGGVPCAELAAGTGMIRVLIAEVPADAPLRDALQRVAASLSARAPHVLWLAAVTHSASGTAALAGWSRLHERSAPRVASFVWELARVVDSDAETLCALSALRGGEDVLLHARCVDVLGRDALTRRFYRTLRAQVDALASSLPDSVDEADAREVALLSTSRMLFLCFLEAKGWLDGDRAFVAARFDECMRAGGRFHHRVLLPLFFGTLNTPASRRAPRARAFGNVPFLNGGLFTRTAVERRVGAARFPDEQLGALLHELFLRFRFVAREDSATWSEASVDPEMLGRAFESLMAASERRASGVYYTPHELVARVAEQAISAYRAADLETLRSLRVLDPACGSGAFLVHVLERLTDMRRERGDTQSDAGIRRDVLARSIFGVDMSPMAVWLCELRLWLCIVIESDDDDPRRVPPLPNLDRNIRVGDALAGSSFATDPLLLAGGARVIELRNRYLRATGRRKETLARMLDREERRRALAHTDRAIDVARHGRSELLATLRARDLFGERTRRTPDVHRELRRLRDDVRRLRSDRRRLADGGALPFSFAACFADVQARGGFDVVVGNPPWVRLHRIPVHLRLHFKRTYQVYQHAQWQTGAANARAAPGFASQVDLAALFVERSVALLRAGGVVSLLVPSKLWRSLAGGGVRELLQNRTRIRHVDDWSEAPAAFDAAVYPSAFAARKVEDEHSAVTVGIHTAHRRVEWNVPDPTGLALDTSPGAPWILLPPRARAAFDRVQSAGPALSTTPFGAPRLGVKSGCNAAFLLRVRHVSAGVAGVVNADGVGGSVEVDLLRPVLRGDSVVPWMRASSNEWILWTHQSSGAPLARLPARAALWLRRQHGSLTTRSDARGSRPWWSLFRVDAADSRRARVVWADFGRRPRALVLRAGDAVVPLNTCYVLPCDDETDAWALATLLNSPVAAAWLNAVAEPARGGYRRYLGWTVGLLPLPRHWTRARSILCGAARETDDVVLEATLAAYGLRRGDVEPLLEGA